MTAVCFLKRLQCSGSQNCRAILKSTAEPKRLGSGTSPVNNPIPGRSRAELSRGFQSPAITGSFCRPKAGSQNSPQSNGARTVGTEYFNTGQPVRSDLGRMLPRSAGSPSGLTRRPVAANT